MIARMLMQILEDFNRSRSTIFPLRSQSEGHTMPGNTKLATASKRCVKEGHGVCKCQEERKYVWLAKFKEDAHHPENKSFPPTPSGIRKI